MYNASSRTLCDVAMKGDLKTMRVFLNYCFGDDDDDQNE
jgi:hypothetical protein